MGTWKPRLGRTGSVYSRQIRKNPLDLSAGYLDWIGMRIAGERLHSVITVCTVHSVEDMFLEPLKCCSFCSLTTSVLKAFVLHFWFRCYTVYTVVGLYDETLVSNGIQNIGDVLKSHT